MGGERAGLCQGQGVQNGEQESKSLWEEGSTSPAGVTSRAWDCQDFSGKRSREHPSILGKLGQWVTL